jgi:hypothetical protein
VIIRDVGKSLIGLFIGDIVVIRIPSQLMDEKRKKVTRLRKCPSRVESLLKALRLVPPDTPLMEFKDALRLVDSRSTNEVSFDREGQALDLCLRNLAQFVGSIPEFQDYILQPLDSRHQDPIEAVQDAIDRYENFRIMREKVSLFAKISQLEAYKRQRMKPVLQFLNLDIDEKGMVHAREDWFTKAVDGIEAARIRECQYCGKVFWAGRTKVQGCSPRCLDCLRKRNKRIRDKDQKQIDVRPSERSRLNETEKLDLIRLALKSGALDQSQIAKQTRLKIDDVDELLAYLIMESREVYSREIDETRVYFLEAQTIKAKPSKRKRR